MWLGETKYAAPHGCRKLTIFLLCCALATFCVVYWISFSTPMMDEKTERISQDLSLIHI